MIYTVRPRHAGGLGGSFFVAAKEAREALTVMKGMIERGLKDVEILDPDGRPYDLAELERTPQE